MERYRRGKGKKALLGSHQKCWIWGRNAVGETLAAGRWPILELYLEDSLPASVLAAAQEAAERQGFPARVVPGDRLVQLCHSGEHQGYLARMADFPYATQDEALAAWRCGREGPALFAVLDGIQDPHNLGAILRSAEVFGVQWVFLPERGGVGVTSLVARSSAGAVNRVRIARVADLPVLGHFLRGLGISLAGASEKAALPLADADLARPTAVVIGNEGQGISLELARQCDCLVRIPQHGTIGSLNAAAAAAVIFYEARRQRQGDQARRVTTQVPRTDQDRYGFLAGAARTARPAKPYRS